MGDWPQVYALRVQLVSSCTDSHGLSRDNCANDELLVHMRQLPLHASLACLLRQH